MPDIEPQASIIIPNFNGSRYINSLCECLAKQKIEPIRFEIIIVDNGSTDNSLPLFEQWQERLPNLRIFEYKEKQSSYAARNYGVTKAQTNLFIFTDVDCLPKPDWLLHILKQNDSYKGKVLISGKVLLQPKQADWNIWEWYDKNTALDQEKYSKKNFGATANLSVPRQIFQVVRGFSEVVSGGDKDFCQRATSAGFKFHYIESIIVKHPARSTQNEIISKQKRLALGHAQAAYKNNTLRKNIKFIVKNIYNCFFQKKQFQLVVKAWKRTEKSFSWKTKFSIITYYAGFIRRYHLVKNLSHFLICGQKTTNKHLHMN